MNMERHARRRVLRCLEFGRYSRFLSNVEQVEDTERPGRQQSYSSSLFWLVGERV